jgi:VIT1/CCC1 family predicted Fe2+/Mn2+ transporter
MKDSHLELWRHELDAFLVYRVLAQIEHANAKGALFRKLALESQLQAGIWQTKADANDAEYRPGLKLKLVLVLLRVLGPRRLLDTLAAMKIRGLSVYRVGVAHPQDETIHAKMKVGTSLRAVLFGINDGLVSNASLVFAMVGAQAEAKTLLLTGLAGLLAGAFSMAVGEYVSVTSQTELFENQISLERAELLAFPEEEAKELSLIYQAKGIDAKLADEMAATLVKDPERALDTLAREELGLNPDELGSGLQAAIASFISFAVGALVPLTPFVFMTGAHASIVSVSISLATLFSIGATVSLLTGKSPLLSGLKMALLGLAAGAATYFVGHWIGV